MHFGLVCVSSVLYLHDWPRIWEVNFGVIYVHTTYCVCMVFAASVGHLSNLETFIVNISNCMWRHKQQSPVIVRYARLRVLREMKQNSLPCQTRVSDTPLEVSPHNSNMINPHKTVTSHIEISSSQPAHLSNVFCQSAVTCLLTMYTYHSTLCLWDYKECIWLPWIATTKLAEMITLQTLSANLLFPQSHLPSYSHCLVGKKYIIVSAAIACFSLPLSDE